MEKNNQTEVIFLSLPKSDFQDLMAETIIACLRRVPPYLPLTETDQWFNITQLCEYLPDKPKRSTVYGWVHLKKIPFHKKSKALIFLKSEIIFWLKEGLHKTAAELEKDVNAETDKFLTSKKRRPC